MKLPLRAVAVAVLLAGMQPMPSQAADWREGRPAFRLGIVAQDAPGGATDWSAVQTYLTGKLGLPVEVVLASDYAKLIDAQASARVDAAAYSAMAFVAADRFCACARPVAAPLSADGSGAIRSILIGRKDKVGSAADAVKGRYATGPADSVTGRILPEALATAAGTPLIPSAPGRVEAGSAEAAEAMFAKGEVDALFGWEPAMPEGREPSRGTVANLLGAGVDAGAIEVLWRSPDIPAGPYAISATLPEEAGKALADALIAMRTEAIDAYETLEPDAGGGFRAVAEKDYAAFAAAVAAK